MAELGTLPFSGCAPLQARAVREDPASVPASPGLYGWFFDEADLGVPAEGCLRSGRYALLYLGIAKGRPSSSVTLRKRILQHLCGNAGASTLRRSVGSVLRERLALTLSRGSGRGSDSWGEGEARLSDWLAENALVAWRATSAPWHHERQLIASCRLPLNIMHNPAEPFRLELTRLRRNAVLEGRDR